MYGTDEPALNDIASMKAIQRQQSREDDTSRRIADMLTDPAEVADLHGTYCDDECDRAIFEVIQAAGRDDEKACGIAAEHLRQVFEKWATHRVEYQLRRAA